MLRASEVDINIEAGHPSCFVEKCRSRALGSRLIKSAGHTIECMRFGAATRHALDTLLGTV